jgi:hypothetical protein
MTRRASALAKAFQGHWRIAEMDVWDNDYLDLIEPVHIAFEGEHDGSFVFGAVKAWLDASATAPAMARPALNSHGKASTTPIRPPPEAGPPSEPPGGSSGTSSSTTATTQASVAERE